MLSLPKLSQTRETTSLMNSLKPLLCTNPFFSTSSTTLLGDSFFAHFRLRLGSKHHTSPLLPSFSRSSSSSFPGKLFLFYSEFYLFFLKIYVPFFFPFTQTVSPTHQTNRVFKPFQPRRIFRTND